MKMDSLAYLAENLKKSELFDNSIFLLMNLHGFTPQEYRVIERANASFKRNVCYSGVLDEVGENQNID